MFGLMEITAQLDEATKLAIIPTVVLPFTVVGMILTSVATWIAALFGVQLKAEGPKKLFEVLMKPKILLTGLVLNFVIYGGIKAGQYIYNGPYPLWWVKFENSKPQVSDFYNQNSASIVAGPGDLVLSSSVTEADQNSRGTSNSISGIEVVWQNKINEYVFGTPQIFGQFLYTGTEGGRLIELDLKTGKQIRQFQVGKPVMTSPTFLNQKVFVGEGIHSTHNARIYAFDLKGGTFLDAFETKGHIERAAVVVNDRDKSLLLFPAGNDGVYAVDAETLKEYWHSSVGHVDSTPVVDDERVYGGTGLEEGFEETPTKVFALNIHTGALIWERSLPTSTWSIPVLWNDLVCFGVGDVYKNTHYGQLTCLDRKTGKDSFAYNTTGALISKPTVIGDSLVVADFHGSVYQFNLKQKTLDWTIQVPTKGHNYASVFVDAQDRVVLPGDEGLYIYNRQDQKLLYMWKPKEKWKGTFTNIVPYKNLWIIADAAGYVRALQPLK
ncbi:MAG: PQQ-binding-like beta-propeller repeat protein [Pseudobdellovibrionaceae bacterium]